MYYVVKTLGTVLCLIQLPMLCRHVSGNNVQVTALFDNAGSVMIFLNSPDPDPLQLGNIRRLLKPCNLNVTQIFFSVATAICSSK